MLALSTIIKLRNGSVSVSSSALFAVPPELIDSSHINSYMRISLPGWSQQELGYWNYARLHENGDLYIYPAILLRDKPKPRRRFPGYDRSFSQREIEQYAEDVESLTAAYQREVDEEFNFLVHDLRQLSTSIHHATEEAFTFLADNKFAYVNERLQNISAMQQMLSIRTDLLDYTGNAQHYDNSSDVAIYKKVDKVVRSFRAYAATKSINLHLEGTSFSRARGPEVLEIVPYVLLDNAIKYSPRGNDITISVFDLGKKTSFQVKSAGPLIEESERRKIFEKGVRGAEAKASGIKGSGAGLFIARQVVDQFRGTISVETSRSEFIIDDIKMTDIVFSVVLPTI